LGRTIEDPPPPAGPELAEQVRRRFAAHGIHLPPVPEGLASRFMRLAVGWVSCGEGPELVREPRPHGG
jgi:hypothetical protein